MPERAPVGLVLGSIIAPERIPATARLGERCGFGELWLAEDFFYTAGISAATAALGATERIPVGTGIVSAVARHPALLAMEVATIARMYPGRFWPGIGLGLPDWLRQMGIHPGSSLSAVGECVEAIRALLSGQELTLRGRTFTFDRVKLTYPPEERVPIYVGAVGPKMLRLAGAVADGVVLPLLSGVPYVAWAREQIAAGAADAGRRGDCRLVVFAFFSVGPDGPRARDAVRGLFALYLFLSAGLRPLFDAHGIGGELQELAAGGLPAVERELPEAWLEELAVVGDPDECTAGIRRYLDAGADSVSLFPMPHDRAGEVVGLAAKEVLPRVL